MLDRNKYTYINTYIMKRHFDRGYRVTLVQAFALLRVLTKNVILIFLYEKFIFIIITISVLQYHILLLYHINFFKKKKKISQIEFY